MGAGNTPVIDEIFATLPFRFKGFSRVAVAFGCVVCLTIAAASVFAINDAEKAFDLTYGLALVFTICSRTLDCKFGKKKKHFIQKVAAHIKEKHEIPPISAIREFKDPTRNLRFWFDTCVAERDEFAAPLACMALLVVLVLKFCAPVCPVIVLISLVALATIAENICETAAMNTNHVVFEAIQELHGVTIKQK